MRILDCGKRKPEPFSLAGVGYRCTRTWVSFLKAARILRGGLPLTLSALCDYPQWGAQTFAMHVLIWNSMGNIDGGDMPHFRGPYHRRQPGSCIKSSWYRSSQSLPLIKDGSTTLTTVLKHGTKRQMKGEKPVNCLDLELLLRLKYFHRNSDYCSLVDMD